MLLNPLNQYLEAGDIRPSLKLFRDLLSTINKGFTKDSSDVLKNCSKIISCVSDTDSGIDEMLEFKDSKILLLLIENLSSLKTKGCGLLLEDLLEMLHVIAESSEKGLRMCMVLIDSLFEFVVHQKQWSFNLQLEAAKMLNLLLESQDGVPIAVKQSHICQHFLSNFGECLQNSGDYELQATIMEALFRIVSATEKTQVVQKAFSRSSELQNSFLAVRNEVFETDCRRFLNYLNSYDEKTQRVYSYPAMCFALGRYQLRQPRDSKNSELWVDINIGSDSISAFVNDDANSLSSEWEMVTIKRTEVKDFRVNVTDEKTVLILKLREPSYTFAPFCPPSQEHYAKLVFAKQYNISNAVKNLFGEVKYVDVPIASPSVSSTPRRVSIRASSVISPLLVQSPKPKKITCDDTVSSTTDVDKQGTSTSKEGIAKEEKCIDEASIEATVDVNNNKEENVTKVEKKVVNDEKPKATSKCKVSADAIYKDSIDFKFTSGTNPGKKKEKNSLKVQHKKGKKLLQTSFSIFQDSPDSNYVPEPVKKHDSFTIDKISKADVKPPKAIKLDTGNVAAFDFPDDDCVEETAKKQEKKKNNGKKSKGGSGNKTKTKAQSNEVPKPKRSTRSKKVVNYNEASFHNEVDFEIVRSTKKSVSFVSPVEETSYYKVEESTDESQAKVDDRPTEKNATKKVCLSSEKLELIESWTNQMRDQVHEVETNKPRNPSAKETVFAWNHSPDDRFDFVCNDESSTPWSIQNAKMSRIKRKYTVNKKKTKREESTDIEVEELLSSFKSEESECCTKKTTKRESQRKLMRKRKKQLRSYESDSSVEEAVMRKKKSKKQNVKKGNVEKRRRGEIMKMVSDYEQALASSQESARNFAYDKLQERLEMSVKDLHETAESNKTIEQNSGEVKKISPLSSVEPSQETEFIDETPISVPVNGKKNMVQDLKRAFSNINATNSKNMIKKKLWKSPVVSFKDEFIVVQDDCKQFIPNTPYPGKRKSTDTPILTPTTKKDIAATLEGVDGFASFCQSIINQSSNKKPCRLNTPDSPMKKKLKKSDKRETHKITPEQNLQEDSMVPSIGSSQQEDSEQCVETPRFPDHNDVMLEKCLSSISPLNRTGDTSEYDTNNEECNDENTSPLSHSRDTMRNVLTSFGSTVNKSIVSRKTSIDKFFSKVNKMTSQRLERLWGDQQEQRQAANKYFANNWTKEMKEWHSMCLQKEKRFKKMFENLHAMFNEHAADEQTRIKRLQQVYISYCEQQRSMNKQDKKMQDTAQQQLRKEIRVLKARMFESSRNTEVSNIRRSLQTLLGNV